MQTNWSLILNVLLLIGVVIGIVRMLKSKTQRTQKERQQPSLGQVETAEMDDIIQVRKITPDDEQDRVFSPPKRHELSKKPVLTTQSDYQEHTLMMFLLAKENRQFAGYELLQTVLACGLRFGDRHLFHRHQHVNGQGPVICSLAAATPTGVFDLQNIGAFSVRGLCLFMQTSGNTAIDMERFAIMLDTAKQLSEGLDAHLLNQDKKPLSEQNLQRYYDLIHQAEAEQRIA